MPPKKGTRNVTDDDGQSKQPHQQNNDEQDGEEDQRQENQDNQNQLSQILATLNSLVKSNADIVARMGNIEQRIERLESGNQMNGNLQNVIKEINKELNVNQ